MTSFSTKLRLALRMVGPCRAVVRSERRQPAHLLQQMGTGGHRGTPDSTAASATQSNVGLQTPQGWAAGSLRPVAELSSPWQIGDVEIPSRIVLAPMAG